MNVDCLVSKVIPVFVTSVKSGQHFTRLQKFENYLEHCLLYCINFYLFLDGMICLDFLILKSLQSMNRKICHLSGFVHSVACDNILCRKVSALLKKSFFSSPKFPSVVMTVFLIKKNSSLWREGKEFIVALFFFLFATSDALPEHLQLFSALVTTFRSLKKLK